MNLRMTIGRDYRTTTQYEYVIFSGEEVVARAGFFVNYSAAKRAGMKAAKEVLANAPQSEMSL